MKRKEKKPTICQKTKLPHIICSDNPGDLKVFLSLNAVLEGDTFLSACQIPFFFPLQRGKVKKTMNEYLVKTKLGSILVPTCGLMSDFLTMHCLLNSTSSESQKVVSFDKTL